MKKKILFLFLACTFLLTGCQKFVNKSEEVNLEINQEEFIAYLVADERCTEQNCDTAYLKQSLNGLFPTLKFEEYDYKTPEGKKLFNDYGLKVLPSILMTKKVEADANYAKIQNYLSASNDLLNLKLGATFDPTKEICTNNIDDTENGKVDCDDSDCAGSLVCRNEVVNKLDLFVMSQCPYGTKALDAMEEVLENFGDKIDFNIHYIANEKQDGTFQSLHGQPEVDENIRELCAIKHYPENYEYMDYIWCRDKNITSNDWEPCAKNFSKIKTCFNGDEGKMLLSENSRLAGQLGIGASPTWMVNNKYQFSGITAEVVKQNLCKYNDLGDVCGTALNSESNVPAGSCN